MDGGRSRRRPAIVLATRNGGKAREFERLLGGAFIVEALPADVDMPEETGLTFADNARLKAEAIYQALSGERMVLADDSGLEVDALGGSPGVFSARFAGEHATDEQNVAHLLGLLDGVDDRRARFVCSLCLAVPAAMAARDPGSGTAEGEVGPEDAVRVEVAGYAEGVIESEPRGIEGFGYDPIFRPSGWTETLGEAATHDKDIVSHRGAAARALLAALREKAWFGDGY